MGIRWQRIQHMYHAFRSFFDIGVAFCSREFLILSTPVSLVGNNREFACSSMSKSLFRALQIEQLWLEEMHQGKVS